MKELLSELDRWLKTNRPDVFSALRPPSTGTELKTMEVNLRKCGFPESSSIHPDLITWLNWHAGIDQSDFNVTQFFDDHNIMNPDWMVESYQILLENLDESSPPNQFNKSWIPIMENSFSYLVMDCSYPEAKGFGQIIYVDFKGGDNRSIVAPNLERWLRVFLRLLEHPDAKRFFLERDADQKDELIDFVLEAKDEILTKVLPGFPIDRNVFSESQ